MNIFDFYPLLTPLLFHMDAEAAHEYALKAIEKAYAYQLIKPLSVPGRPVTAMGLHFPNAVGLAAGLDKTGRYIDALATLGFGFIEVGTVTPKAQDGNPKPRIFRIPENRVIINRMGFNNVGLEAYIKNIEKSQYVKNGGIIGLNIGKNATTPIEEADQDYLTCLKGVYPLASYITVNISSPNTQNLRQLQHGDALSHLLNTLKTAQAHLATEHHKYVPLVVKVAPDLTHEEIQAVAKILQEQAIDGLIATNTTLSRPLVDTHPMAKQSGGLSGAPLKPQSDWVLGQFAQRLSGKIPIIGVGGITTAQDAQEKIALGANLVQLYSGLIYRGPALVSDCIAALSTY